jgi:hypothetical protein
MKYQNAEIKVSLDLFQSSFTQLLLLLRGRIYIYFIPFVILLILLSQPCHVSYAHASLSPFRATPDRVLVLYNAEWSKDVDGSEPGQDSQEVAEYYVKMHTDPITGKKPYLLGLRCVHKRRHLNNWFIEENSQDNIDGLVFVGKGKGPRPGEWARDSRHVEIVLEPRDELIDWDSVEIWCQSDQTGEKKRVSPVVTGIPQAKGRDFIYPEIEAGKGRCYRFDAHNLFKGTVWVIFKARDTSGKLIRDLRLTYYDLDDFEFSKLGPDGISDEKHFLEDVAMPVKKFLEDPDNALPDGTLLKNHILYIVICHGLPFSCEGVFGIERGATSNPGDHGDLASMEQRLQTLYYDWGGTILPPVVSMYMSGGPDWSKGVRNYRITSAMRYPLVGRRWNPYAHPDTYSFLGAKKESRFLNIPPFQELRGKIPESFFSYGVSRIDGQGPREAKRLIDYSLYATKFLRPEMEYSVRTNLKHEESIKNLPERLEKAERENKWGTDEEECLGFTVSPDQHKRQSAVQGIPFLMRPLEDLHITVPTTNCPADPLKPDGVLRSQSDPQRLKARGNENYSGYYPGGIDFTVDSGNGWNCGATSPIWRQVDQGVTMSACGGPAFGGGPHITNGTFWDNRILLRYLLRGRDLGECFLLSTFYVNWSTSLLGDPLLHPNLYQTIIDTTPPRVAEKEDIRINLVSAMGKYAGTMTIPVISTTLDPEVSQLSVFYCKKGEDAEQVSHCRIYSTQPQAVLRNLDPEATYLYRPVLTDPYGNTTDLTRDFGQLSFRTSPLEQNKISVHKAGKWGKSWTIDFFGLRKLTERGTISVNFIAGEHGLMPSVDSRQLKLETTNRYQGAVRVSMEVGGPSQEWDLKSPLQKGEEATLILRWRRFPLTREVLLLARDGTEFTLVADVRTPWEEKKLEGPIEIKEQDGVQVLSASIIDDAQPASPAACGITVPPIDGEAWRAANK